MNKLDLVIKAVEEETGAKNLTAETRIDSLGIDSLDFIALVQTLENLFNCRIEGEEYVHLQTVEDLAAKC